MTQILATESLDFNPAGIKDYFDKAQAAGLDTQTAQASWRQIASLIRQCHLLNEQNGASIALLMRHASCALCFSYLFSMGDNR